MQLTKNKRKMSTKNESMNKMKSDLSSILLITSVRNLNLKSFNNYYSVKITIFFYIPYRELTKQLQ